MRYRFIEDHRDVWPIVVQCDVLQVSRGGFYAWRKRSLSGRARRRAELTERIREIHAVKYQDAYGAARVHRELVAQGCQCNRKTVAACMKQAGIRAKTARKFRVCTTDSKHRHPVAPNVVDRNFTPSRKNETWTADVTYIPTGEGWLYLAAVEDLYSRKIVGWSMSERMESRLVVDALEMAVQREVPGAGLTAHSDRGSQYASEHYQVHLKKHSIRCSMSRQGNCWDNAPMESFFGTLKKELVHHVRYATRQEARVSLFEYIETFYNRIRRHSSLGYVSPDQFEQAV